MSLRKPDPPTVYEPSLVYQPDRCHRWSGRRILPPDGLLPFPGPAKLRRHRRKAMIRVDLRTYEWHGLSGWYATIEAEGPDAGSNLVAFGDDLDAMMTYLVERFDPCCVTVQPTLPINDAAADAQPKGGA